MQKYELLYIVHPDLESSIDKITDRVRSFVESRKGKVNYEENWGKRKLAYEIKKNEVGIYVLVYFEAPTESLAKIERDLRLTEEVIRFMILATSDKIKTEKKPRAEKVEEPKIKEEKIEEEKPKNLPDQKVVRAGKAPAKKIVKKEEPKPTGAGQGGAEESEEERMKQLDEKLGAILGDEEKTEVKEKKVKSKKSEK